MLWDAYISYHTNIYKVNFLSTLDIAIQNTCKSTYVYSYAVLILCSFHQDKVIKILVFTEITAKLTLHEFSQIYAQLLKYQLFDNSQSL